jgi:U3 small nucleolar RNA-associated protein 3
MPRGGALSDSEPDEAGSSGDYEDEFYKASKEQSQLKKAAKATKYSRTATQFGAEEKLAEGKRGINKQIEKNKGLTPHRKKAIKNPRVKQRMRHAKAVINRKGQVRDAKVHTSGYGGEASGIKSSISRSVRMQS